LSSENGSARERQAARRLVTTAATGTAASSTGSPKSGETTRPRLRINGAKNDAKSGINGAAPDDGVVDDGMATPPSGGTTATVQANASLTAGRSIDVIADERMTFTGIAGGIQGGFVAVGASILVVSIDSNVEAIVSRA
jgi:hypothetical protein